jgi:hypothetical protein
MPGQVGFVEAALPHQLAERKKFQVEASVDSYELLTSLHGSVDDWISLGTYHSHVSDRTSVKPSPGDLDTMDVGDLELICWVRRRDRKMNRWMTTSTGRISVSWGRFRFLLGAYVRTEGVDRRGEKKYNTIRMTLE